MAQDHALGPGDRIDVSVFSRPELSRPYRVRLDGSISLHIIGAVRAAGRTPAELESLLEERLGEVFEGITSTTVEVVEYRPVAVNGHVAEPGSYPFEPHLDVARAVALAGGFYRLGDRAGVTAQMRVEAEAARHAVLRARLASSLIERARLVAERDGAPDLVVPDEAKTILNEAARELAEAQAALREARDEQLSLRIENENDVLGLAVSEASAYAERQELIGRQLEATLRELAKQEALAERGLGRASRLFDLRLSAEGYRVNELEAVALEAEARQRASAAEAGIGRATGSRATGIAEQIAALNAETLALRTEMEKARQFVLLFAGASALGEEPGGGMRYRVRRRGPEGVTVMTASPDMELAPGDMLEVSVGDPAPVEHGEGGGGR